MLGCLSRVSHLMTQPHVQKLHLVEAVDCLESILRSQGTARHRKARQGIARYRKNIVHLARDVASYLPFVHEIMQLRLHA